MVFAVCCCSASCRSETFIETAIEYWQKLPREYYDWSMFNHDSSLVRTEVVMDSGQSFAHPNQLTSRKYVGDNVTMCLVCGA